MDFRKVVYENTEKKKTFISQQKYIYIYMGHRHYEFYFVHILKGFFVFKKVIMLIILCVCINTPNITN